MCTVSDVEEFLATMKGVEDPAIIDRHYDVEGEEIDSNDKSSKPTVEFYSYCEKHNIYNTVHHIFNQIDLQHRINHAMAQENSSICKTWILLDNQSTVDVFHNSDLLVNIREVDNFITIHYNAGNVQVHMMGELAGYGLVWYYPDGIANILSLYRASTRFHIEYNSRTTGIFRVWKDNETYRDFRPSSKGLYFSDCENTNESTLINEGEEPKTINTVAENMTKFNARQIRDAEIARKFQNSAGLSTRALLRMIDSNVLINSPITRKSVRDGIIMWGVSEAHLKGKTTRSRPDPVIVDVMSITSIPPYILEQHGSITIGMDVMKVNKASFLVSISRVIRFGTGSELINMKLPSIIETVIKVLQHYYTRGFKIVLIVADNGFASLLEDESFLALGVRLNITSEDEHEPHVERFIRTIKEKVRMVFSQLPFEQLPRRMTIELVYCQIFWYNFTIPEDYISEHLSPGNIILGRVYDYSKICGPGSSFGEYVQTHERTDNTLTERTVSAITLRPSGNLQGSFYYYSLVTGRRLHRRRCTPLPMPQDAIDRIHLIAEKQGSPEGIEFLRMNNETFEDLLDLPDTLDYNDAGDPPNLDNNDGGEIQDDVPTSGPEIAEPQPNDELEVVEPEIDEVQDVISVDNSTHEENENEINIETIDEVPHQQMEINGDMTPPEPQSVTDVTPDNILPEGSRRGRVPKIRSDVEGYEFLNETDIDLATCGIAKDDPTHEYLCAQTTYINSMNTFNQVNDAAQHAAEHLILTQLGMKAGIKAYGEDGIKAILKEMKQFHDREVVRPLKPTDITPDVKKRALGYLMFLKKKRSGEIKGRGCADGRPQRIYKSKMETSSPTAHTESIFMGCAIDAREGREVAHVDIPGAFLQTQASDETIIKLQGVLVLTLLKINPEWEQFVTYEGKKRVPTIYSEAIKALYGTVDAAKLFYENLSSFLVDDLGFKLNLYDPCVANKKISGSQCTIMWHVDDLKESHLDEAVVTDVINSINKRYGEIMPISISRGKVHDYLGMVFDYSTPGEVMIHMYQYISELIASAPEVYKTGIGSATPAPTNLYEIRDPESEDSKPLNDEERNEYHTLTAQCLYLSKRARPDLQTSIAFHCTRVRNADKDDQKKLARTIRYLEKTKHLPMILRANKNGVIEWWIDASFAVHNDMKSRSGTHMSLGSGTVFGSSSKQKINASSSTEAELIAVADAIPKILWCRYFLENQGYIVEDVFVHQDNESAILLENNGMKSVGKGSRHIKIKYFFVTDKIKDNEMRILHCPTEDMMADFYTKPLQGALFTKHRDKLLGIDDGDVSKYMKNYDKYIKTI